MPIFMRGAFCREERGMKTVDTTLPPDNFDDRKPTRPKAARKRRRTRSEREIDESMEESFPASDPPSWTLFARIGSPR